MYTRLVKSTFANYYNANNTKSLFIRHIRGYSWNVHLILTVLNILQKNICHYKIVDNCQIITKNFRNHMFKHEIQDICLKGNKKTPAFYQFETKAVQGMHATKNKPKSLAVIIKIA